jgi:di/tricarboxylate transporter
MPIAFFNAYHFIFPFNGKSNLIYFGMGYIDTWDMAKSGIIISFIAILVFMFMALTFWRITGLTP